MTSQTTPPPTDSTPSKRRGPKRRDVVFGLATALTLTGVGVRKWMRTPTPEPDTTPFADYFTGRAPVMSEPTVDTEHVSTKSWGVRTFLTLEENTPVEDAIALIQSAYTDLAANVEGLAHATLLIGWNGTGPAGEDLYTAIDVDLVRPRSELDFQCERLRVAAGLNQGAISDITIPLETDDAIAISHIEADSLPADAVLAPPAAADGTALAYEDRLGIGSTSLTISATSDVDLSGVPLDAVLAALPGGAEDPSREPIVTLDAVGPGYADGLPTIDIYEQDLSLDEAELILRAFDGAEGQHAIRLQVASPPDSEMRFLLTDGTLTQDPSWHTAEEEMADLLGRL
ncbi:hypothetical protein DRB06_14125 [Actinomyces sp. Z5]|uniref:hypothetical protein n=1 Tax=Actinomyces sp. Z5 TaxID=2250216 RepID=UPI000DCCA6A0|nr:hypothetical protein [Actinomyces sp. Z5]RAX19243.1 hypothetical protein DRB06_14125 [Actinomyces sp. Z5]